MKIYISQYSGFCFGVKRAIEIAQKALKRYKNVYIIEDIVHNQQVSKDLKKQGIRKVKNIEDIPQKSPFLINAHGISKSIYEKAKKRNLKIIDTTCPIVKNIHKKAIELENEGYGIIIIGDKNHVEVQAIRGSIKEGIIVGNVKDLKKIKNIPLKIGCICQSTQNIENVASVIYELVKISQELKFINTICKEIEKRQEEIKRLSKKTEAVIIVGSKKSANTWRLFEIAKNINPYTFFIETPQKLKKEWKRFNSIGIAGGASTPLYLLKEVEKKLYDL